MPETLSKYQSTMLDAETSSVVRALLYFDIFSYPLTAEEISRFLPGTRIGSIRISSILKGLEVEGSIFRKDNYYLLRDDDSLIERREKGNRKAEEMMKKARRYSSLINRFPFVRSVCISGSLSKGFLDEEGDIDYFIITKPGRLWISRSMLIMFKKIFLGNRHRYFCVNYFIDTEHLEIPDKNIFTATELLSLIPMSNETLFRKLQSANSWTHEYLPNFKTGTAGKTQRVHSSKKLVELAFEGPHGDWIDKLCMKLTVRRWNKKFKTLPADQFEQALRSRPYVSKHHPRNFQMRVLNSLEQKEEEFERRFNVRLSNV